MSSHTDAWVGTKRGGAVRWMERTERGAMHELGARLVNEIAQRGFALVADTLARIEIITVDKANKSEADEALDELHDFFSGAMAEPLPRASFGFVKKPSFAYLLDVDVAGGALHLFRGRVKAKADAPAPPSLADIPAPPGLALVASIPGDDVAAMQTIVVASSWPLGAYARAAWEHAFLIAWRDPPQRALLTQSPVELLLMKLERNLPKDGTFTAAFVGALAKEVMERAPTLVQQADRALLPRLIARGDETVQRAVAARADLDDDLRATLRRSKYPVVVRALAANATTPPAMLAEMFARGSDDVKESVVENPAAPLSVLEAALASADPRVRERAAFWSATGDAHALVLRIGDATARRWLAANPRISADLHARLVSDEDAAVAQAARANTRGR